MDEPGYHARKRAEKEASFARRYHSKGLPEPVPLAENISVPDIAGPDPGQATGYTEGNYRPPLAVPPEDIPGATHPGYGLQGAKGEAGPPAGKRPQEGSRRMDPHLQLMCGPMLRYDTVTANPQVPGGAMWLGYCMVVTADAGSIYEPLPSLALRWRWPNGQEVGASIVGQKIWEYHGTSGSHSFWRFALRIPLSEKETAIKYSLNGGYEIAFYVPAQGQNLRWVGHSCNGFSSGVDVDSFNGPDPLWKDVLAKHKEKPYHCVIGGGDQLYCDAIAKEPELAEWIADKDAKRKALTPLSPEMRFAIDRFMFNHYCTWFRSGAFGRTISCIPMLNMLDDHDLIDGFGSYPDELQMSPVFSAIGGRGYFWFLLFQCFVVDEVDGTSQTPGSHTNASCIIGGEGAYIPFPSHSFLSYLGPKVYILLLDCRAERRKNQVCSKATYERVFDAMRRVPEEVGHLVILLGIPVSLPILYPRMVFAEKFLDSPAKSLLSFMPGFSNKFNNEAELLDDMSDHWCAGNHKEERNWLLLECQKLSAEKKMRITFLSGDVHIAAAGRSFTKGGRTEPEYDPRFILNIISSAIVNTPPPPPLIGLMGKLAQKTHKTLHHADTDEDMVPCFEYDTEGTKLKNPRFMGRRNYASVQFNEATGELEFDMRIEIRKGMGETKGYLVCAPPALF